MNPNAEISRRLLQETLEEHRRRVANTGYSNFAAVKFAGGVAVLLGERELLTEFQDIAASPGTSIPGDQLWAALTSIRSFEEVAESYPILTEEYWETHLDQIPDHDFDRAFSTAANDLDRECVLLTQVVRGQAKYAIEQSTQLTDTWRAVKVRFVATIEAERTGCVEDGDRFFETLPETALCDTGRGAIALGISGRAAWGGYPYPDY